MSFHDTSTMCAFETMKHLACVSRRRIWCFLRAGVNGWQRHSQFARVAKGVDLRSTAGNCAWVRTPQLTKSMLSRRNDESETEFLFPELSKCNGFCQTQALLLESNGSRLSRMSRLRKSKVAGSVFCTSCQVTTIDYQLGT